MSLPDDTATRIVRALIVFKNDWQQRNPGRVFTLGPAAECVRAVLKREMEAGTLPKPKRAKGTRKMPETATDEAWIAALEQKPCYAGVDVRRELGKCQVWCETNKAQCSRKRFVNWLAKAERTIAVNGIGKSSFTQAGNNSNMPPAPKGWLAALRDLYPQAIYFMKGGDFEITDESDTAWRWLTPNIREAIINKMKK